MMTTKQSGSGGPKAQALVEKVLTGLENALSMGVGPMTRARLEALKPDVDGLIKMSGIMMDVMKFQVSNFDQARAQTLQDVGASIRARQELEKELEITRAELAREYAKANQGRSDIKTIRAKIAEISKERSELAHEIVSPLSIAENLLPYGGLRSLKIMLQINVLNDEHKEAESQLGSSVDRQNSLKADIRILRTKFNVMEHKIYELRDSIQTLDRKSKAFGRRLVDYESARVYYGQLRNEIENLSESLGIPPLVAKLLETKELEHITGDEVGRKEKCTLKELLIHLGGEYDQYEHSGLPAKAGLPRLMAKL